MLGGVVERAPAVPTPMEVRVGGAGANGTRASAGMVEGHLPKIEADLSFRVVPRGGYPGVGGGQEEGEEEAKSLGDYGLGVDGGPLTEDEVEDEKLEDKEEDDSLGDNDAEADENDRCVCVCLCALCMRRSWCHGV